MISPDNYDIVVNTKFWTKLKDQKSKDGLYHKFDQLASSSSCKPEKLRLNPGMIPRKGQEIETQPRNDSQKGPRKPVWCYKCYKLGHIAKKMSFKLQWSGRRERSSQEVLSPCGLVPTIVGKANEVSLWINGEKMTVLLDTGSMVITMAGRLFNQRT